MISLELFQRIAEVDNPNDKCKHGPPILFQEDQIRLQPEIKEKSETLNGNHSSCLIWKTGGKVMEK
jgi:hypothetical protein